MPNRRRVVGVFTKCVLGAQRFNGLIGEFSMPHEVYEAVKDAMTEQSAYNKRLNAAGPLISHTMEMLARQIPTWHDDLRLIGSTPPPCAASRESVKPSHLVGNAHYGYCRSHSHFFWGLRLIPVTTAESMYIAWCLASPKLVEREVAVALWECDHQLVRARQANLPDRLRGPGVRDPYH